MKQQNQQQQSPPSTMHFNAIVAAAAAFVACSQAAAILPRNKHVADFRLYGLEDCNQKKNLGIWTVIDDDFKPNECKSLNDDSVKSVRNVDILGNCKLHVYTDAACHHGRKEIGAGQCQSSQHGYKAWSMKCH
ncbi:hypothetical protein CDD83_3373 [Cordyceps sp. RAO-2017]|nr:hypothetical protein CDD83_3373 [Cordyceps sp. RAO-2017]